MPDTMDPQEIADTLKGVSAFLFAHDAPDMLFSAVEKAIHLLSALESSEAENARLKEAFGKIERPQHGLDGSETETERAEYWAKLALLYRDIARTALQTPEELK